MVQVIEMTRAEQHAMYMKCTKSELANLLIQCNSHLSAIIPTIDNSICQQYIPNHKSTALECINCGIGKYAH